MSKISFKGTFSFCLAMAVVFASCKKDNDSTPAPIVVPDQSFDQGFESMTDATTQGWVFKNLSDGADFSWTVQPEMDFYGDLPFEGTGLLYSNYSAGSDVSGNISDWAISPKVVFQNGDKISFYARSSGSVDGFPDRLQLRLNTFNTSDSLGETSSDIGNFSKPLLDINQSYSTDDVKGFPSDWAKYEVTISGLNKPDSGRFAFRYYLELQGGANGDEIAIDKVSYVSASK